MERVDEPGFFGVRNVLVPFFDSAGATLYITAALKSISFLGEQEEAERCTCDWFMPAAGSRGYLREVTAMTAGVLTFKLAETIFWLVAGVLGLCCCDSRPMEYALHSFIQIISNLYFCALSMIGWASPKWSFKVALYTGQFIINVIDTLYSENWRGELAYFGVQKVDNAVKGLHLLANSVGDNLANVDATVNEMVNMAPNFYRSREISELPMNENGRDQTLEFFVGLAQQLQRRVQAMDESSE